jgi:hypothetical protein
VKRVVLTLSLILLAVSAFCTDTDDKIGLNELAPNVEVTKLLSPDDYLHLGLDKNIETFRINDIKGDVLVLELFNRFCLSCIQQASQLQALWEQLETEGLKNRVRVLALGQGNGPKGVNRFRSKHKLTYPIAADPEFSAMSAFGDPGGTPLSLFMVRDGGSWLLTDYHIGKMKNTLLLAGAKRLLAGERIPFTADRGTPASQRKAPPEISENTKTQIIASVLNRVVGKPVRVKEITLADGTKLFQAIDPDTGPMDLFVRVTARRPVCDLCHTNTFAFAFDTTGKVVGFQPIYVTKIGNQNWSDDDTAAFESRLTGRKMTSLGFDPDIDAVTGATMSSSLIYDEIRRTAAMLDKLSEVAP